MPILSAGKTVARLPNFDNGFTLLELLTVMAIIAMMAALVIPHIGSGQVSVLKAQVREAVAVLNYARRSAIVEGQAKTTVFYNKQESKTTDTVEKKIVPGQWVSRGARLQWGNQQPQAEQETSQKITFYPEGGSSGGEFILSHQEFKAKITVNPLTGKIKSELLNEQQE
ncbi:MAG: GspH/FimT family pseudopilin [Pseudomonadota bacterium]|nr:GspH/FimT family pseudopilin [Pseudomonadota bacterium]